MAEEMSRGSQIGQFEDEAALLLVSQLDLLTLIEAQLRAVHHTLRRIQRLQSRNHRVGPELSNGERTDVLTGLTDELSAVDSQLLTQLQISRDMQSTIGNMQQRLITVKQLAEKHEKSDERRDDSPTASD
jgi:hypothetical protein